MIINSVTSKDFDMINKDFFKTSTYFSNKNNKELEVLVVDDSLLIRKIFSDILSHERKITVSTASDPMLAIQQMKYSLPDVIILDIEMPRMDGLTFLKKIMFENPIPVIICSHYAERGSHIAFEALDAGAVDIIEKPRAGVSDFLYDAAVQLVDTVIAASKINFQKSQNDYKKHNSNFFNEISSRNKSTHFNKTTKKIVAIGASTGGPIAIQTIVTNLQPQAPGIVIVQHMPNGFTRTFANRLNKISKLSIKEAENNDEVKAGKVLIAPGNHHVILTRNKDTFKVNIIEGPLINRHRPSIDVLFKSVAQTAKATAIGILLTGMGNDGAEGLLEMKKAGAKTIAESEKTCAVFGMPRVAIEKSAAGEVLPLSKISSAIISNY